MGLFDNLRSTGVSTRVVVPGPAEGGEKIQKIILKDLIREAYQWKGQETQVKHPPSSAIPRDTHGQAESESNKRNLAFDVTYTWETDNTSGLRFINVINKKDKKKLGFQCVYCRDKQLFKKKNSVLFHLVTFNHNLKRTVIDDLKGNTFLQNNRMDFINSLNREEPAGPKETQVVPVVEEKKEPVNNYDMIKLEFEFVSTLHLLTLEELSGLSAHFFEESVSDVFPNNKEQIIHKIMEAIQRTAGGFTEFIVKNCSDERADMDPDMDLQMYLRDLKAEAKRKRELRLQEEEEAGRVREEEAVMRRKEEERAALAIMNGQFALDNNFSGSVYLTGFAQGPGHSLENGRGPFLVGPREGNPNGAMRINGMGSGVSATVETVGLVGPVQQYRPSTGPSGNAGESVEALGGTVADMRRYQTDGEVTEKVAYQMDAGAGVRIKETVIYLERPSDLTNVENGVGGYGQMSVEGGSGTDKATGPLGVDQQNKKRNPEVISGNEANANAPVKRRKYSRKQKGASAVLGPPEMKVNVGGGTEMAGRMDNVQISGEVNSAAMELRENVQIACEPTKEVPTNGDTSKGQTEAAPEQNKQAEAVKEAETEIQSGVRETVEEPSVPAVLKKSGDKKKVHFHASVIKQTDEGSATHAIKKGVNKGGNVAINKKAVIKKSGNVAMNNKKGIDKGGSGAMNNKKGINKAGNLTMINKKAVINNSRNVHTKNKGTTSNVKVGKNTSEDNKQKALKRGEQPTPSQTQTQTLRRTPRLMYTQIQIQMQETNSNQMQMIDQTLRRTPRHVQTRNQRQVLLYTSQYPLKPTEPAISQVCSKGRIYDSWISTNQIIAKQTETMKKLTEKKLNKRKRRR